MNKSTAAMTLKLKTPDTLLREGRRAAALIFNYHVARIILACRTTGDGWEHLRPEQRRMLDVFSRRARAEALHLSTTAELRAYITIDEVLLKKAAVGVARYRMFQRLTDAEQLERATLRQAVVRNEKPIFGHQITLPPQAETIQGDLARAA